MERKSSNEGVRFDLVLFDFAECLNYYCVVPENIHTSPMEGFLVCTPHPLGISIPRGSLLTPPSPQEFPCYANMNFFFCSIHFQQTTLCYGSILFACLPSSWKCSMLFTKICLNRVF